ncbi:hypothetical protein K6Y31_11610 [Motilimonas cestriensis]|uniref:Uncharacterized protein n=1 Tax=Motilimonas cestriensis TaxID=2742685 RepID=A0ABS8W8Y1_9GAMM|nr:hypothetical protein [Motilimonas cestriensis]MCE2595464.1 hypothetical protein [Motilimonas cestriensis]
MSEKVKFNIALVVIIFIFVKVFYSFWTADDFLVELERFNVETPYKLSLSKDWKGELEDGKLGDFYACLLNYRGVSSIRRKSGDSRFFYVYLPSGFRLNLNTSGGEVNSFKMLKLNPDGSKEEQSGHVAVNCPLSLLTKDVN